MVKNITKGSDNELFFRIKELVTGNPVNINSDFEYDLLGIRIFLFSKFRKIALTYHVNINGDEWIPVSADGIHRIEAEDKSSGIISIKVTRENSLLLSDGPYYMRGILYFSRLDYPDAKYEHAVPKELLYCGVVIGENDSAYKQSIEPGDPIEITDPDPEL